ncbi:hemolysin family protein [Paenibacillus sp. 1P07SE]|uniref:hemolysin family protein n=1 Tax=Paenibacillus sp. 1P07SE TaxID=3132209 RepID=UPI0039A52C82
MSEVPLGLILTLGLLIFLSAFFSSAETAFSSANKIRLRNYAAENRRGSHKALYIVENFDHALSTILVGNNIVNIAAASISSKVAIDLFGASTGLLVSTFGMTLLILVFGEILPKSFAKENAEQYALTVSGVLLVLIRILTPVNFVFGKLKAFVSRVFSSKADPAPSITEEEIKVMVDISEEEGVINEREKDLVHRSLAFNEITVSEILTHRMDVIAVEVTLPVDEVKDIFLRERFSRIPVYEDSIDHVIGILSEREFLAALVQRIEVDIKMLAREPLFVMRSTKISTLLNDFQKSKNHMAIVVDEFGGTVGLVTLEDILEELVGEIWDEHDDETSDFKKIGSDSYLLDGKYELDNFAQVFQIPVPDETYQSVGGWIFKHFGRTPDQGESFLHEHLKITAVKVENNRTRKVRVDVLAQSKLEQAQMK